MSTVSILPPASRGFSTWSNMTRAGCSLSRTAPSPGSDVTREVAISEHFSQNLAVLPAGSPWLFRIVCSANPERSTPSAAPNCASAGRRARELASCDLRVKGLLQRVIGMAVALHRPAVRAADRDHRRMLAGAVVVDLLGRAAVLQAAVALALGTAGVLQERADCLDVQLGAEVRGGCDREVVLVEFLKNT